MRSAHKSRSRQYESSYTWGVLGATLGPPWNRDEDRCLAWFSLKNPGFQCQFARGVYCHDGFWTWESGMRQCCECSRRISMWL
jgi:hypothetical protein